MSGPYPPPSGWAQPHPYPPQQPRTPIDPPPGIDYPGKALGIVGLIVAIFANVVGIVISAIALDQSKRAGFRNGPAKAGVIVGSVLLGTGLVIGIVFAVIDIVAAFTAVLVAPLSAEGTAPSGPAPYLGPGPSEPAIPGETFGGQSLDYAVGDCFLEPTAGYGHVQFVDCAEPHDYEVYAEFEVPDTVDRAYPGLDRMTLVADAGCRDAFADFTGSPWERSAYDYEFIAPDDYTWASFDDRLVSCAIHDPEGPTTGTLRAAEH